MLRVLKAYVLSNHSEEANNILLLFHHPIDNLCLVNMQSIQIQQPYGHMHAPVANVFYYVTCNIRQKLKHGERGRAPSGCGWVKRKHPKPWEAPKQIAKHSIIYDAQVHTDTGTILILNTYLHCKWRGSIHFAINSDCASVVLGVCVCVCVGC